MIARIVHSIIASRLARAHTLHTRTYANKEWQCTPVHAMHEYSMGVLVV